MTSDEPRPVTGPQTTNGTSDPTLTDRLDRYWDAVTGNGYQRAEAIAIDPARARTVDQLQTLAHAHDHDHSAGMPAGARSRIWRATAAEAGIPTRQESPVTASSSSPPAAGHAAPTLTLHASSATHMPLPASSGGRAIVPGGGRPAQPGGRALWPRLQFAVAAVLILGLFATILAPMDDDRIGLFGGGGSTPTSETAAPEFAGGGGSQTVPAFAAGLTLRLYQLTLSPNASFDLPDGSVWTIQGLTGNGEFVGNGEGRPTLVNATRTTGTDRGGRLSNVVDGTSVFWVSGLVPREAITPANSGGATLEQLATGDVSSLVPGSQVQFSSGFDAAQSEPASLRTDVPPPGAIFQPVPGSRESGLVYVTQGQIRLDGLPAGAWTLTEGAAAAVGDIGPVTVTGLSSDQDDGSFPDRFYTVSVQPYTFDGTARIGASTVAPADIPSIGYPEAFTGTGSLIDLPPSATGHTVTLDRVTVASGAKLTLPSGSARKVSSINGSFTADRGGGSAPLTVDQPSQIDIGLDGGSISADHGEDVTVTILTIVPEGTASLASSDGVTVYSLTTYTTGALRFESQQNVLLGNGPVPVDPAPVPPSTNTDDPQNLDDPGTTMLLYAEQGSIVIDSPDQQVRRADSADDLPSEFATSLTIAPGESAIVSNPSEATIRQATPGEGAVYSVVFLSPPTLDRTLGRTYPNTAGGGTGLQPVPADGDDYRIVLDRLTLDAGVTATFPPGTFRAVQWTGGGTTTMTSDDPTRPAVAFEERSLNASFEDQGFRLVATGNTPVTLTLMSYLPAGSSDETVPSGQEGLSGERLSVYTAPNPFNADHLQFSFYAAEAEAFPLDIAPAIGLNIGGGNPVDSYALIRPEGGPIVLNRSARRIVDGAETTEIVAGIAIPPGETVRVDDLRDATIQGSTDGTPAGYTLVVVSPYDDPYGNGPDANATPELTGLTPASLDAVAGVPADQPLDVTLVRQTLGPGAAVTVAPAVEGTAGNGESLDPVTVLSYVAAGSGTIGAAGQAPVEIASRSSELATSALTTDGPLTVTAGSDGLTVYDLIIGTGPLAVSGTRGAQSVKLGSYTADAALAGAAAPDGTVQVRAMLRASVGALGDGGSQNLGRDGSITLLTPLVGDALILPGVGDIRFAEPGDADRNGTAITGPWNVTPDGGVIAAPGGQFRVAAIGDSLSFLWAEIEIVAGDAGAGTPATSGAMSQAGTATPAAGTPAAAAAAVPACDIAPRTVDELLRLYDEGIANPVDPYTLGHRDDLGTGTPADDATIAAITDTLLRQSACQSLNDPLRQYALSSDDYLRVVLPIVYDSRDQLASLLEQPASRASAAALPDLAVSDVELFADGRVGARVALDHEFAYVTLSQAPDGTWLLDLWDDRDEPGA